MCRKRRWGLWQPKTNVFWSPTQMLLTQFYFLYHFKESECITMMVSFCTPPLSTHLQLLCAVWKVWTFSTGLERTSPGYSAWSEKVTSQIAVSIQCLCSRMRASCFYYAVRWYMKCFSGPSIHKELRKSGRSERQTMRSFAPFPLCMCVRVPVC